MIDFQFFQWHQYSFASVGFWDIKPLSTFKLLNRKCGLTWLYYTHKRLRLAYRCLKSNLQLLFTWYDNIDLKIPNTTNAIDGHFADLKNKLRNHNGLSLARKKKFIDGFLKAWSSLKNINGLRRKTLTHQLDIFRRTSILSLAGCSPAEPTSVLIDMTKVKGDN